MNSLLRVLIIDYRNTITNALFSINSKISSYNTKIDKVISDNIKGYIYTCLKKKDNDTCNARFIIAIASLESNPADYAAIKVRLDILIYVFKIVTNV